MVPKKITKKSPKLDTTDFYKKYYNSFVEISCFELWTVLIQFLGTIVKTQAYKSSALYLSTFLLSTLTTQILAKLRLTH